MWPPLNAQDNRDDAGRGFFWVLLRYYGRARYVVMGAVCVVYACMCFWPEPGYFRARDERFGRDLRLKHNLTMAGV